MLLNGSIIPYLTWRRVFALSSDGISLCRNHVEQVKHVDYVYSWSSELELESGHPYSNSNLELELETPTKSCQSC